MKETIKVLFFPWAGGTSRIYSSLCEETKKQFQSSSSEESSVYQSFPHLLDASLDTSSTLSQDDKDSIKLVLSQYHVEFVAVDLPGRLVRPNKDNEEIISDFSTLGQVLINEIFLNDQSNAKAASYVAKEGEQYVLFGHSFGAMLAYEIAKQVEAYGITLPLALFVSASRPPSAACLTSSEGKPVSTMDYDEMRSYFLSRGSNAGFFNSLDDNPEVRDYFVKSVHADYTCLETYKPNDNQINCPLVAIGSDQDCIVSVQDTKAWEKHAASCFDSLILKGKGHFYLDDSEAATALASIIHVNIGKALSSNLQDEIDIVKKIYSMVLRVDMNLLDLGSDFFECGGSSLDTIALISQIKAHIGIHIPQNEFFLNPKIVQLAVRAQAIKKTSVVAPQLVAIDGSVSVDGEEHWFPASPGQEQMLSCWEMAPVVYNMPTTIEFTDYAVEIVKLREAFRHVVEQQSSLRTVVAIDPNTNEIVQKVLPQSSADECFKLDLFQANSQEEAKQIVEKESLFEFDLSSPPVVRGVLVEVENSCTSYFLLNQHHVGSDGWSRTQLRRQLLQTYTDLYANGKVSSDLYIPSHPNYIDWTLYLDKWLHDYGQQERQLKYWKNKLADLPVLNLPTDKPRPAILSARGARIPVFMDSKLTYQFTSFVSERGANLYAGLIAAYMLMLHRIGGGDDFAIGIALANRHHEGMQNLIGYFANEVAVRASFDKKSNFVDVLDMVRTNILEGMANADVPFHKVTEHLKIKRDSSRTSVFQAMFALQERNWHSLEDLNPKSGNIRFQLKNQNHNTSKFEVHLQLRHDGKGALEGDLHIATDLFTVESGERMAGMFLNLVKSCTESPSKSIRYHEIMTQKDTDLIARCNSTSKSYEKTSILDFQNESPDNVAFVVDGDCLREVTYGEFQQNISNVSSFLLHEKSVRRQEKVGLLIQSSAQAMSAIYGVINSACTIVVLDPEKTPIERCKMVFDDADVNIIIVDDDFQGKFQEIEDGDRGRSLYPLSYVATFDSLKEKPAKVATSPDDTFGIFYTSGTTGVPKGAVIKHSNVLNLVSWWKDFFEVKPKDSVLLFSSLSFIMSLRQYLPTLHAGATVVIPENAYDFESAIVAGKVNKLICTPSALASLDMDEVGNGIEAIQLAGEAPSKNTLDTWQRKVPKIFIGLGPTELCAHAVCSQYDGENICIGYPAANVRVYIVDPETGMQCPVNVPGELWIAGDNVSFGYLNKEEITKKSFGHDMFGESSQRLYKTGDLAKRLACGRIQFIGRNDRQLKVNGFRMEASEICNAMPNYIAKSHVMVLNNVLTLFVCPISTNVNELRSHLLKKLPTYMVPNVIHVLDDFPLNKNRKLDQSLLLSKVNSLVNVTEEEETSGDVVLGHDNRIEKTLKLVWSQILKVDAKGIKNDDNFFSLGGTSLSAVVVSRMINKELQVELSVHDVFIHQTIQSLAQFINDQEKNVEESTSDPHPLHFLPGGRHELHPYVFTFLQFMGLVLMSIIATVPIIATISLSVRSFIWFGDLGVVLFPLFLIGGCLVHTFLVILCKWIVIGRYKTGKAKTFSLYFLRWWLVRRVLQVTRLYTWVLDETHLSGAVLRLLGASIGKNVSVEQPFLFEPDLCKIGSNSIIEFETQFATSEIKNGFLELRGVTIEDNVKVGVRSILLGGAYVHRNSEIAAKTTVDYLTSTTREGQRLVGSPAVRDNTQQGLRRAFECSARKVWRPIRGNGFLFLQILSAVVMIYIMTVTAYVGTLIGRHVNRRFGSIALVVFLGSAFQIICCFLWLFLVAILKWVLIPKIEVGKLYSSAWFALRKWFLDRMFLSPLFVYASQRVLQTSSTFPWYLKLLGAKVGRKAWINHPMLRVGVEHITIGDDFHMGMHAYFSTERHESDGIWFDEIKIGDHSSFGQRCVALGGINVGSYVTIGAETILPFNFCAEEGSTAFGSPPVKFTSTALFKDIVDQSQSYAKELLLDRTDHKSTRTLQCHEKDESGSSCENIAQDKGHDITSLQDNDGPSRMQDIGTGKFFWLYITTMILIQGCLPLVIGGTYGSIYYLLTKWVGVLSFELILATVPLIYIVGSIALMIVMKVMQMVGGDFSIGTANFFSFRFFYWHIFADMVYLCTSTIIYPFSGTEIYCIWLRFMGAKIGKKVFISPENGGFREIDFMDIGDNCVLMTPNIHAHYTDHSILQFCPVKLEDGCEINVGATVMPLTMYGKNCRLRPFAVTVKGQHCKENTSYEGNPCKAVKAPSEKAAILFTGQGCQYPGMLESFMKNDDAKDLLYAASEKLSLNIEELCSISADAEAMQDTRIAQPIVFVADLMAAEMMRQKVALDFSKRIAVAGFSLGELAALCFAGAISYGDALDLIKVRADAMASCNGGAMCNLRGVSRKEANKLAKKFNCSIANIICNHDCEHDRNVFVISGSSSSIDSLIAHINVDVEAGSRVSAKKLRVSAAFHSDVMKPAQMRFKKALANVEITLPTDVLVYSNVTGRPYRSVEEIRELLSLQISSPVEWHDTILDMVENEGISRFIECGPMNTLSKMVALILPDFSSSNILTSDEKHGK